MNSLGNTITAILTSIFTSASKLVFLMIAVTVCVGLFTGKITQDNFIYLAVSVFSYYFGVAQGSIGSQTLPPQAPRDPDALTPAVSVTKTETTTTAPPTVPGVK